MQNDKPESDVTYIQLEKDALDIINMRCHTRYRSLLEINLAEILNTIPKPNPLKGSIQS
ncbi:MAG TPA: hypothetical protein PKZ42_04635 [Syntrophales bacterium]|nr:hypothetical protein [Syntrophales bacterium]